MEREHRIAACLPRELELRFRAFALVSIGRRVGDGLEEGWKRVEKGFEDDIK